MGDGPWLDRTLYLQVPKDAPGVTFQGEWDPLGMRGTVSRDMVLHEVFVPDEAEILPPGLFGALFNAYPHLPLSFSATFLGLMQASYDYAIAYLTGKIAGAPGLQTEATAKGYAVAEMLFTLEAARALYYRAISEAQVASPAGGCATCPCRARHGATLSRDADPGSDPGLRWSGDAQTLPPRTLRP